MIIFCEHFEIDAYRVFKDQLPAGCSVALVTFQSLSPGISNNDNNIYTANEVSRGVFFDDDLWVLNETDLIHYEKTKGIFLNVLSRFAYTPDVFSVEEMAEHYLKLINFWTNKILTLKPDAIFESYLPHLPSSFALFLVSKYLRIPYIFLDFGPAYKVKYFSCSYRERMLLAHYHGGSRNQEILDIGAYINSLITDNDLGAIPEIKQLLNEKPINPIFKFIRAIRNYFPYSFSNILRGKIQKINAHEASDNNSWIKATRRAWSHPNSQAKGHWEFARLNGLIKKANGRNKIAYRRLCVNLASDTKYIYYAAHYMPEGGTLPSALELRHQFPFLKMLSDCLPTGWVIAFKENPVQFQTLSFVSPIFKSEFYYEELAKIKNLVFVAENIPSSELIPNSMGVATINGTIGIEAPYRGKYVFISASNYHESLDGVIRVRCKKDIERGIELMISGKPPNPQVEQLGFKSNFIQVENFTCPTENDYIAMSKGFFTALEDFKQLDDRKWEL